MEVGHSAAAAPCAGPSASLVLTPAMQHKYGPTPRGSPAATSAQTLCLSSREGTGEAPLASELATPEAELASPQSMVRLPSGQTSAQRFGAANGSRPRCRSLGLLLHGACAALDLPAVEALARCGALPSAAAAKGRTPLHTLAATPAPTPDETRVAAKILDVLVSSGAQVHLPPLPWPACPQARARGIPPRPPHPVPSVHHANWFASTAQNVPLPSFLSSPSAGCRNTFLVPTYVSAQWRANDRSLTSTFFWSLQPSAADRCVPPAAQLWAKDEGGATPLHLAVVQPMMMLFSSASRRSMALQPPPPHAPFPL